MRRTLEIGFVIASQRVRPEVAGPMKSSAKQIQPALRKLSGLLRRWRSSQ
jgi:hypothetical protein